MAFAASSVVTCSSRHASEHRAPAEIVRATWHSGSRPWPPFSAFGCCGSAVLTAWSRRWTVQRRSVRRAGPSEPQNLYELLGLSAIEAASAPLDLLKQRQRALLRVCHPDVAGDGGSAVTSLLSEAVNLLSTFEGRIEYEAQLQGETVRKAYDPQTWQSLPDIKFANDEWENVADEERGEKHAAQQYLAVDEAKPFPDIPLPQVISGVFPVL